MILRFLDIEATGKEALILFASGFIASIGVLIYFINRKYPLKPKVVTRYKYIKGKMKRKRK